MIKGPILKSRYSAFKKNTTRIELCWEIEQWVAESSLCVRDCMCTGLSTCTASCVCIKALELGARRAPVCAARVSRAILMAVCCNGIQADVCSQTASGSQLPIYNSHTWIHTHTQTHTFKSSRLMAFFFAFFAFWLFSSWACVHARLCVFMYLCLSPRKPITPSKSMNCAVFALVNKPKISIDHREEGRLISSKGKKDR